MLHWNWQKANNQRSCMPDAVPSALTGQRPIHRRKPLNPARNPVVVQSE